MHGNRYGSDLRLGAHAHTHTCNKNRNTIIVVVSNLRRADTDRLWPTTTAMAHGRWQGLRRIGHVRIVHMYWTTCAPCARVRAVPDCDSALCERVLLSASSNRITVERVCTYTRPYSVKNGVKHRSVLLHLGVGEGAYEQNTCAR